jgi:hypothetical protein
MIRAYFQMLLDEAELCKDLPRDARMGETAGKMKQFATWFTHGVPGGAKLRRAIYTAKTGATVLAEVDEFFQLQLSGVEMAGPGDGDEAGPAFPEESCVCD